MKKWQSLSIKSKLFITFIVFFVLYIIINLFTFRFIIFPRFQFLEQDEARHNLDRIVQAIQREINHLDTLGWDWASWDETYDFVVSRDQSYITKNLVKSTFTDSKLNVIYISDPEGRAIWSKTFDLASGKPTAIKEFPPDRLPEIHPLREHQREGIPVGKMAFSGILDTEKGAMLMAYRPILTSNNEGPVRGWFIMGRLLSKAMIKLIVEQTRVKFTITPLKSPRSKSKAIQTAIDALSKHPPYYKQDIDPEHFAIFTALKDVNGNQALLIQADARKDITKQGRATLAFAMISNSIAGTCLLLIILWLVQRSLVNPIKLLTQHVSDIGRTGDVSPRLSMRRRDEIGVFADVFDAMIGTLERQSNKIKAVNADLTIENRERKRAEKTALESWKRYRMLFEEAVNPILVMGPKLHLTDCNQAAVLFFEKNKDELIKNNLSQFVNFPDGIGELDLLRSISDPAKPLEIQYDVGGKLKIMELMLTSFKWEDGWQYLGIGRDVTEQRQLQAQLQQKQKLEAIGTLAGGVAHDFNNILMTVLMNIEYVLRKHQNPEVQECLNLSLAAAHRAKELVEQLLTFSYQSAKAPGLMDMVPITKASLNILRASLPSSTTIQQDIQAGPLIVLADPVQINQLLINLCTNAADAMHSTGGQMTVCLRQTELREDIKLTPNQIPPGPCIQLSIQDSGKGIPHETLDRIFEPFFTTKNPGEGSGMGLAVVHGILKSIDGGMRVTSEQNKGTCVDVFFPAAKLEKTPAPAMKSPIDPGSERILIVDDEVMIVDILERVLSNAGYRVTTHTDSHAALDFFRTNPQAVDLVITDQTMPGIQGSELAQRMLAVRPYLPIILYTGYGSESVHDEIEGVSIRKVLSKPISTVVLGAALREILSGASPAEET